MLLAAGADPNDGGDEPLLISATQFMGMSERPALELVHVLLEAGADPDPRGEWGMGPLHHAAAQGSLAGVKLLLRYGADPKPAEGQDSPLAMARRSAEVVEKPEHQAIIELLEAAESGAPIEITESAEELIASAGDRAAPLRRGFEALAGLMSAFESAEESEEEGGLAAVGSLLSSFEADAEDMDEESDGMRRSLLDGLGAIAAMGLPETVQLVRAISSHGSTRSISRMPPRR